MPSPATPTTCSCVNLWNHSWLGRLKPATPRAFSNQFFFFGGGRGDMVTLVPFNCTNLQKLWYFWVRLTGLNLLETGSVEEASVGTNDVFPNSNLLIPFPLWPIVMCVALSQFAFLVSYWLNMFLFTGANDVRCGWRCNRMFNGVKRRYLQDKTAALSAVLYSWRRTEKIGKRLVSIREQL
jgi:hypothetical protein